MSRTLHRRSRARDSDDDSEVSRQGTPASTAPEDRKRARRDQTNEPSSSRDATPEISEELGGAARRDQKPPMLDGFISTRPQHQPGAIVRVKLTNFVTYTSAEFFPGPNLNMVIGPNGTGKSTLVCAICLGLGWGTGVLGRAKDVSDFVKHGCGEARIEIELQKAISGPAKTKRNPIFSRTIKRDGNKSVFYVNGQQRSQKFILELARSLDIQVDNLCQFLPQDKVVEFAAMTPIELLQSTQQAVAPAEMLNWHENLKTLRGHQRELYLADKANKEHLTSLESAQDRNRVDVERVREKLETQKHVDILEKCRPVVAYGLAKQAAKDAREAQKRITAERKSLEKEVEPALRKVNAKEHYLKKVQAEKKKRELEVTAGEKDCKDIDTEDTQVSAKMNDCTTRVGAEKRSRQPKKEEKLKLERLITSLNAQKARDPPPDDFREFNARIERLTARKREIETSHVERKSKLDHLTSQKKARQERKTILETQHNELGTMAGQQLSKLERISRDTHRAWTWIKANPEKFEKEVFGPPMVTCSLKDPRMADVIESFFQRNDSRMIIFQTHKDFVTAQQHLRSNGLHDVSLRECSVSSLDSFRPPLAKEQMDALGLDGWAIDHLQGPTTVLAFLCQERNLHRAAVSQKDISNEQYNGIIRAGLNSFVAGNVLYRTTRRAEYGTAGETTQTSQIRPAKFWTAQAADASGDQARLKRQIAEIDSDIETIVEEARGLVESHKAETAEYNSVKAEIETVKVEKETGQKELTSYKALPTKIAEQEQKLDSVKATLAGMKGRVAAIEKERDGHLVHKAELAVSYAHAVTELGQRCEALLEAELWLIEAQSDYDTLKSRNEGINQMLEQKRKEDAEAETLATAAVTKARTLMNEVVALGKASKDLAEAGDDTMARIMEELSENKTSVADLEALIESDKAKLDLIQGLDGNILTEFENGAEQIAALLKEVAQSEEQLSNTTEAIQEVREKWEPKLDELVGRISDKFGESFARIGCAGQVVVHKASAVDAGTDNTDDSEDTTAQNGNGLDFANWAIHISVKFRENEPLSLLNAHRQSGGERAVSTIFYLMALQSLSRAPFRVVDEINQGMDPRNERMVHGLMVDIAIPFPDTPSGQDGDGGTGNAEAGSQYFLITPKLLSGLKYRRGMTVLCIVSGENMPAAIDAADDGKVVTVPAPAATADEDAGGTDSPAANMTEEKKLWKVDFKRFVQRARDLGIASSVTSGSGLSSRVDSAIDMGLGTGLAGSFASMSSVTVDGERAMSVDVGA